MGRLSRRRDDWEWMKFYPDAWLTDVGIAVSSLAAQGLWCRLWNLMWKSGVRGALPGDLVSVSRLSGHAESRVIPLLQELEQNKVFERGKSVSPSLPENAIVNRRMWREYAIESESGRTDKKGWVRHYPDAWCAHVELALSSLEAQGLWSRLYALLWKSQMRGVLAGDLDSVANLSGRPVDEISPLLAELKARGIFEWGRDVSNVLPEDAIVLRWMWMQFKKVKSRVEAGRLGGLSGRGKSKVRMNQQRDNNGRFNKHRKHTASKLPQASPQASPQTSPQARKANRKQNEGSAHSIDAAQVIEDTMGCASAPQANRKQNIEACERDGVASPSRARVLSDLKIKDKPPISPPLKQTREALTEAVAVGSVMADLKVDWGTLVSPEPVDGGIGDSNIVDFPLKCLGAGRTGVSEGVGTTPLPEMGVRGDFEGPRDAGWWGATADRVARLVDRCCRIAGDRRSQWNWRLLAMALLETEDGAYAAIGVICEVEERLERREPGDERPRCPGAMLNKRLRAACARLGVKV